MGAAALRKRSARGTTWNQTRPGISNPVGWARV